MAFFIGRVLSVKRRFVEAGVPPSSALRHSAFLRDAPWDRGEGMKKRLPNEGFRRILKPCMYIKDRDER